MLVELLPTVESERIELAPQVYQTLSKIVAKVVADLVKEKPNACLGLPTGRTPTAFYNYLSQSSRQGEIDWRNVRCFGLDDYVDADEPHSFRRFLKDNLYVHTNVREENLYNPVLCKNNYDEVISEKGGLDLCILGLGRNGHIAFNEPGTPRLSFTHSVTLSESTRQANAEFFTGKIPTRGVTMGISTILAARRIILMVTGGAKKEILTRAMRGPVTRDVPASFLQEHDNVMVLADFDY